MCDHEFPDDLADLDRASVARMVGTDLRVDQRYPVAPRVDPFDMRAAS